VGLLLSVEGDKDNISSFTCLSSYFLMELVVLSVFTCLGLHLIMLL
jgi:hypothetical protein